MSFAGRPHDDLDPVGPLAPALVLRDVAPLPPRAPALARGTGAELAPVDSGRGQGKEPSPQTAFPFAPDLAGAPQPAEPRARAADPPRRWNGHDQLGLTLGAEHDEVTPPIPRTYADCKGPAHQQLMADCGGTCPVLRCRHHLALWVRDHQDDSDEDRIESIKIEGGVARGRTARGTRSLTHEAEDALATMVEHLADRLQAAGIPSMCSLEYADRFRITPKGLRWMLGLQARRMSKLLTDAADELDIARAKLRRQEAAAKAAGYAAKQDAAARKRLERDELVQIRRRPTPCK